MQELKRLEEITRDYSKLRACGAGLGTVWAALVMTTVVVILLHQIYASYLAQIITEPSLWRYIHNELFRIPDWLKLTILVMPFIVWFGMQIIQIVIDRRTGFVRAKRSMHETYALSLAGMSLILG